jgi:hypothetical protein
MELLVFAAILVLLGIAAELGWTVDSRDGADWAPTNEGRRIPRH